jgi:hypothetical protein
MRDLIRPNFRVTAKARKHGLFKVLRLEFPRLGLAQPFNFITDPAIQYPVSSAQKSKKLAIQFILTCIWQNKA